jgi:hypothetical protein
MVWGGCPANRGSPTTVKLSCSEGSGDPPNFGRSCGPYRPYRLNINRRAGCKADHRHSDFRCRPTAIEIQTERMATIGYVGRPSNADLTKRYFRERPGDERTHIHVRHGMSNGRCYSVNMRSHVEEHSPYVELKRALAVRNCDNRAAYTEGKSDHLWGIIDVQTFGRRKSVGGWSPGYPTRSVELNGRSFLAKSLRVSFRPLPELTPHSLPVGPTPDFLQL